MEKYWKVVLVTAIPGAFNEPYVVKDLIYKSGTHISWMAGDPILGPMGFTGFFDPGNVKLPGYVGRKHIGIKDVLKRVFFKDPPE